MPNQDDHGFGKYWPDDLDTTERDSARCAYLAGARRGLEEAAKFVDGYVYGFVVTHPHLGLDRIGDAIRNIQTEGGE